MTQLSIPDAINAALQHHSAGRLPQAEAIYRQVLALQPENPDALHLLGLLACSAGQYAASIDLIRRAIAQNPNQPVYHGNLGEALRRAGKIEESLAASRRAIELNPTFSGPFNNMGLALMHQKKYDDAMAAFQRAIQLQPQFPEAHANIGDVLTAQGRYRQAVASYQTSLQFNPNSNVTLNNLGIAYLKLHCPADALACFQNALRANPKDADAWLNLGNLHTEGRNHTQALQAYQSALTIEPQRADAYSGIATLLKASEHPDDAIEAFNKALAIRPDAFDLANIGLCFRDRGQPHEAAAKLREALELDPAAAVHSALIVTLLLDDAATVDLIETEKRAWNQRHAVPLASEIQPHTNDRSPDRPLRIGYVSSDFREHPVGRFMLPLLAHHDRKKFHITCYSGIAVPDDMTAELQAHADLWHPIANLDEEPISRLMRNDRIDILVDLAMHTRNNHLLAFARKPAPVQVSYLAYAGGSGLHTMDYHFTDAIIDPPAPADLAPFERPWRLPDCFWCYAPGCATPPPNAPPALTRGTIAFASLSHMAKITQPALELWAQLLNRVPNSTLCLHIPPGWAQDRCRAVFQNAGIALSRLLFEPHLKLPEYFASYHRVDIALDPFPYSGGTTTCDALWMGVPVVALAGIRPTSRSSLSILTTLGLPELAASTHEDYLTLATYLANDLPRLTHFRQTLRPRMQSSPLTDAPTFVSHMESAYRQMWQTWCKA